MVTGAATANRITILEHHRFRWLVVVVLVVIGGGVVVVDVVVGVVGFLCNLECRQDKNVCKMLCKMLRTNNNNIPSPC